MTDKEMNQKITSLITDTLKNHKEVHIKGLGTFSVMHQKQDHRQEKDGRVLLAPPSDIINFESED